LFLSDFDEKNLQFGLLDHAELIFTLKNVYFDEKIFKIQF